MRTPITLTGLLNGLAPRLRLPVRRGRTVAAPAFNLPPRASAARPGS
ncbi:hypothetical protein [Phenylobacterium sp.]|nr:hypothetical protein [Phenylobacterium sp.]